MTESSGPQAASPHVETMAARLRTIASHLTGPAAAAATNPNLPHEATEITPDVLYECVPLIVSRSCEAPCPAALPLSRPGQPGPCPSPRSHAGACAGRTATLASSR